MAVFALSAQVRNLDQVYQLAKLALKPNGRFIWATTTPVPFPTAYALRNNSAVKLYNRMAAQLWETKYPGEVATDDLYADVIARCGEKGNALGSYAYCELNVDACGWDPCCGAACKNGSMPGCPHGACVSEIFGNVHFTAKGRRFLATSVARSIMLNMPTNHSNHAPGHRELHDSDSILVPTAETPRRRRLQTATAAAEASGRGLPCTPLANLSLSVGHLSPAFSPAFCGHSYDANSDTFRNELTIVTQSPGTIISAAGPHGVGGINGIPGVATGMPVLGTGTLTIPLQLTQNLTQVVFTLNVTGAKSLVMFSVEIKSPRFRFANSFGDHMVLQRSPQRANVLGFGAPGAAVEVSLVQAGATRIAGGETLVQEDGTWMVSLPPVAAIGAGQDRPWVLSAVSKSAAGETIEITLEDVLFGDVWVCSGGCGTRACPCISAPASSSSRCLTLSFVRLAS